MGLLAVLVAPVVVVIASRAERALGPSAGGWVAALPVGFTVAILAVLVDSGSRATGVMALSAAAHVVAQAAFAVVLAEGLSRWGWTAGAGCGVLAYLLVALGVAVVPAPLALALAVPALIVASRLIPVPPPRASASRHWSATVVTCAASAFVVGGAVLVARSAGPAVAGAVAAFPTTSTTFAAASSVRAGIPAAVSVLGGLVRSLPCYVAFCLVTALLVAPLGPVAVPVALLACVGVAGVMWRTVPVLESRVS